jgi:hypothetical protein
MVSITGIAPHDLDLSSEYPVLAVNVRYTCIGYTGKRESMLRSLSDSLLAERQPFYNKETFFLIGDKNDAFRWVSNTDCSFYIPGLPQTAYPVHTAGRAVRYGINKNLGENKNMINPVRPFSITGINMDGFDPQKEYPVLAIDMDQYLAEEHEDEEAGIPEDENECDCEQHQQSQTLAFFLVGDDQGEFAWVAEDECRLFPLNK